MWNSAPYAALVVDAAGTVRIANDLALALFPGAGPGARLTDVVPRWLTLAHQDPLPDTVRGRVGDRAFEARPTRGPDGDVVWWLAEAPGDAGLREAREALRTERRRTAFLTEASNALLSSLNAERCADTTARLAAGHLADAALVVAPPAGRGLPVTRCSRGGAPVRGQQTAEPAEMPGLAEALGGFPPVPSRWIDPAHVPDWVVPEGFGPVGSIVVAPLPGQGGPAGALILLRYSTTESFTEDEEIIVRLFAARAGAALYAARMYLDQAAITETLMAELLPPSLDQVAGVELAAGYRAAGDAERVGGDFYDVHPTGPAAPDAGAAPSGEYLVVLGDVCGKGLEAAVLTGKIRNTLHALVPMADDHPRMLRLLNGALLSSRSARFATLVMASTRREGSHVRLRLTSAGHPAPLIVRSDGRVEEAATRGTLVGALPEIEAHTVETSLAPGETCVLYTDGITEARGGPLGGDLFGDDRLRGVLAECAGLPGGALVERVQMLASQWVSGGRHDDMAIVAVTAPRTNHLSAVGGHGPGRFTP